ncbi:hypothetical protein J2S43_005679 [Catenuloplanes nepalensis]|uniref:Uncharacterized protein n=1 Tax=Catenuloplanes nepalensis TaxID=587533 RepID=A0ABT9N0D8_9ACTN|nr:hypothetical protein [Catenuloplanes nepalensis]
MVGFILPTVIGWAPAGCVSLITHIRRVFTPFRGE